VLSWIKLLLAILPVVREIIRMIRRHQLSQAATREVLADLEANAQTMILKAKLARAEVKDDPDEIANDPYNRD